MNAHENPFRVDRLHAVRFRLSSHEWEGLMDRLATLSFRAAVIGPHGSGKTTLLREMSARLVHAGTHVVRIRLNESQRFLSRSEWADLTSASRDAVVFIDGAEQLSWLQWRWLRFRVVGGLVISRHSPGGLPTLYECSTSPALLSNIMGELLADSNWRSPWSAEELLARFEGNVRDALRFLYDECANARRPSRRIIRAKAVVRRRRAERA